MLKQVIDACISLLLTVIMTTVLVGIIVAVSCQQAKASTQMGWGQEIIEKMCKSVNTASTRMIVVRQPEPGVFSFVPAPSLTDKQAENETNKILTNVDYLIVDTKKTSIDLKTTDGNNLHMRLYSHEDQRMIVAVVDGIIVTMGEWNQMKDWVKRMCGEPLRE